MDDDGTAELFPPTQADRDFFEGVTAFPAGQWMDAQRGKHGYPSHPRCPFRRPERVAAWERGYRYAYNQIMDSVG